MQLQAADCIHLFELLDLCICQFGTSLLCLLQQAADSSGNGVDDGLLHAVDGTPAWRPRCGRQMSG